MDQEVQEVLFLDFLNLEDETDRVSRKVGTDILDFLTLEDGPVGCP
jgi:hypothetical protein